METFNEFKRYFSHLMMNEIEDKSSLTSSQLSNKCLEIAKLKFKKELDIYEKYKKNMVINEYNVYLHLNKNPCKVDMYVPYRYVHKEVKINDVCIGTTAIFKRLHKNKSGAKLDEMWETLKKHTRSKHYESQFSASEYLVKDDTIYRYSDHWGECATCLWYIEGMEDDGFKIGKAHVSDFKRIKESWGRTIPNPNYESKMTKYRVWTLNSLKKLISDGEYYITDKAMDIINKRINKYEEKLKETTRTTQ